MEMVWSSVYLNIPGKEKTPAALAQGHAATARQIGCSEGDERNEA